MTRPIDPTIDAGGGEDAEGLAETMRGALARWPTGVSVVAVRDDDSDAVHGLTVSSFCSVSLDPPLVLVCLYGDAPVLSYLREAGRFTVNLLAEDQRRIASLYADRFPAGSAAFSAGGDPVLEGSIVAFACAVHETHAAGDHLIVVGAVQRVVVGRDAPPLLRHDGEYRGLDGEI